MSELSDEIASILSSTPGSTKPAASCEKEKQLHDQLRDKQRELESLAAKLQLKQNKNKGIINENKRK